MLLERTVSMFPIRSIVTDNSRPRDRNGGKIWLAGQNSDGGQGAGAPAARVPAAGALAS